MPAAPRTDRAFVGVQRVGAALARGWSPYELRGPLWLVPHRGLRVVAGVDPRDAGLRIAVAAALLPPGGALAGWAAVHVHRRGETLVDGLDLAGRPLPIELVVPVGHRIRRRSTDFPLRVREVRLEPGDVVTIDGVPVTSLARTAFDIARHADLVEAVVLLDALFAPAPPGWRLPVEHYLEARAWWPGVVRARQALRLADPRAESPMESRLRLGAVLGGLPRPAVNEPLFAGGRFVARPDLLLAQARLGPEYDGAEHRKDSRRSRDRRRERRTVRELDILLMSFDVADLRDPLGLRDELVQLYETRSGLVLPRPLPVPPRLLPC